MATFKGWPRSHPIKPKDLSVAGFFYTGNGDRVCCFNCNGVLKHWEYDENPWEQHAMWYSYCTFLIFEKGMEFIRRLIETREKFRAMRSTSRCWQVVPRTNLCKICFNSEYATIFLPCGHIIACETCASSPCITKCPACRQSFTHIQKIYF